MYLVTRGLCLCLPLDKRKYLYLLLILILCEHFFIMIPVMDGSLPKSLKHIISNAEYYGPSLFLLGKHIT